MGARRIMDFKERRAYPRIKIDAVSKFTVNTEDSLRCDFEGIIDNVSEEGIGVIIRKTVNNEGIYKVGVGDELFFQAVDEFALEGKNTTEVLNGKARIVRINILKDGYYFGCKIVSDNVRLKEYIRKRKISFFIDGMVTQK